MSHPEIPQGHERFRKVGTNEWHFIDAQCRRLAISRLEPNSHERQDCAAHAASWWFARWANEEGIKAEAHAYATALDWLAWGKGE